MFGSSNGIEPKVQGGENKDKFLVNHHIVTEVRRVGERARQGMSVPDFSLAAREGCTMLLQDDRQGPISGADACPAL